MDDDAGRCEPTISLRVGGRKGSFMYSNESCVAYQHYITFIIQKAYLYHELSCLLSCSLKSHLCCQ